MLMFCMLRKRKYVLLMFQNITLEKQVILFMIANGGKSEWSKTLTTQVKYEGGKTKSEGQ